MEFTNIDIRYLGRQCVRRFTKKVVEGNIEILVTASGQFLLCTIWDCPKGRLTMRRNNDCKSIVVPFPGMLRKRFSRCPSNLCSGRTCVFKNSGLKSSLDSFHFGPSETNIPSPIQPLLTVCLIGSTPKHLACVVLMACMTAASAVKIQGWPQIVASNVLPYLANSPCINCRCLPLYLLLNMV